MTSHKKIKFTESFPSFLPLFNNAKENYEIENSILNNIEKSFRAYAGSYLSIDTIVYRGKFEKIGNDYLSLSRRGQVFSPVEIAFIEKLMETYRGSISRYQVYGNKIKIYI